MPKSYFIAGLLAGFLGAQSLLDSPIGFRENKGQVYDQHGSPRSDVLFSGSAPGLIYHLSRTGLLYQLAYKEGTQRGLYRIEVDFVEAQPSEVVGEALLPGYENFYNVPEGCEPVLFVRSYRRVRYAGLWPGITLRFEATREGPNYELEVAPGADERLIRFRVRGAEVALEGGELIFITPVGLLRQSPPRAWAEGRPLEARWQLLGPQEVGLYLEGRLLCEALFIDPAARAWGTYYGGEGLEVFQCLTVDAQGNIYATGSTTSAQNVATSGVHQTTLAGDEDVLIVKFSPSGGRIWATYYGGSEADAALGCALDVQGNLYVAGGTSSSNGIATSGTHQPNYGGPPNSPTYGDAFLAKFSASGTREWGTYFGGSSFDGAYSCAVDQAGNLYVSGSTSSSSGIASSGAHQGGFGGGVNDAFLAKFSSTGARLWATYYGGSGSEEGLHCTVDAQGNLYLCGSTNSSNNIATAGTHKPTLANAGSGDAFLAKFSSNGQRQWGTYYGGSAPFADIAERCLIGKNGEIYLIGRTPSEDNIATSGTHQSTYGGGSGDGFVARLNSQGQREWGTYFGGSGVDDIYAAAIDTAGNVVIAGYTESRSRIATPLSHQPNFTDGNYDGFLALLSPQGQVLRATYVGGELDDEVFACAVSRLNEIYVGGTTSSRTQIGTGGTHQPNHYGQGATKEAFLMKFSTQSMALPVGVPPVSWRAQAVRGGLLLESEAPLLLEIWEAAGRQVSACQVGSEGVRLHALPPGVYVVRDSEGRCAQKVLVSE
ncbi:MAG: hypothetical protein NZ958_06245 [Bacteroidia bacterium]|nr:hypothetical protein [Bacteroidia bacterium]MDW8088782.1 hypothetical protein [Bacteroidia bacterium]